MIDILGCTLPMGLSPIWNGEKNGHRNQYELLTESILEGHINIDYGEVDPKLLEMDNPYDLDARIELGVDSRWDHAFYNGKYYMYFGVVPVFLLFLPYRLVTGRSLTTYHATQIFVALFICGVFALFYILSKKFFEKITLGMYLLLSSAFAIISVWYSIGHPALYCTAITAGICMEIWSLFFFVESVWISENEKRQIIFAFWGSFFGALAFGCRPPIALANILVLPMLFVYLKGKRLDLKRFGQLVIAAMPYFVIGILLMLYNYVRFENPFEFGQSYQLTTADQSNYGNLIERFDLIKILNGILTNFISYYDISETFPYISLNGALVNFPILLFPLIGLGQENVRKELKKRNVYTLTLGLCFLPFFITIMDVLWAPNSNERYRMDIYWLMGLLCFLVIGFYYISLSEAIRCKWSWIITMWAFVTICTCVWLWLVPNDSNYTELFPEMLEKIRKVIFFGS